MTDVEPGIIPVEDMTIEELQAEIERGGPLAKDARQVVQDIYMAMRGASFHEPSGHQKEY